jgi:endonuclease VIII
VPEGDTVWLAGHRLAAALAGQTLVRGELRHPRWAAVDLAGVPVTGVVSVGKHLLTRLGDGRSLHTHFRMDGAWHLYRPGRRWPGPAHQVRAVLAVPDRVAVGYRLHDMALVPTAEEHRLIGHLGPDLLGPNWGPEQAAEAARRLAAEPDRELGPALLDQTVLAGVGNLYQTEVCFLLGVSPWSPVSGVDPAAAVALCRQLLLRNAARPEQSTTGELRRGAQHWIFGRAGRGCLRCGTVVRSAVQRSAAPGSAAPEHERISYWCPTCQPGPHPAAALSRSGTAARATRRPDR